MDNKVIYVDFNSTSRKSNEHKVIKQKKSFFRAIIDRFKALFGKSNNKCLKKANPRYKHWL